MTLRLTHIEAIELTEEEIKEAIYEAKLKKFFHERSKGYYEGLEKLKDASKNNVQVK